MKQRILTSVDINCDPPKYYGRATLEELAKYYERWIIEFHDFIRDHRSQDPVFLSVERKYSDLCSFCHGEWETDENGCPVCCNAAVKEWEESKEANNDKISIKEH